MTKVNLSPERKSSGLRERVIEQAEVKSKRIDTDRIDKEIYGQSLREQSDYMRQKRIRILSRRSPEAREDILRILHTGVHDAHRVIKEAAGRSSEYKKFRALKPDIGRMATQKAEAKALAVESAKHFDFTDMPHAEKLVAKKWADILPMSYKGVGVPPTNYEMPAGHSLLRETDMPEALAMFYDDQTGLIHTPSGCKALLLKSDNDKDIVIAFAGTEPGSKSKTGRSKTMQADTIQRLGGYSTMYHDASGITRMLLECNQGKNFKLVGHSLGGGLSQHALGTNIEGDESKLEAWTFNSAGLSASTLGAIGVDRVKIAQKCITNVRTESDPISPGSARGEMFKGVLLGKAWTIKREGAASIDQAAHFRSFLMAEMEKEINK
jgi:hypothetical protein